MTRSLLAFFVADALLFAGVATLGFFVDGVDYYAQHFALALFAIVLTVLIHVIVFMYLAVSSKMMIQAVHLGELDEEPLHTAKRYKSSVVRWVGASFLTLLPVVAFGALTDRDPGWRTLHFASACVAIAMHFSAFVAEYKHVSANASLMACVFDAYNAKRLRGGDDPGSEPRSS